MDGGAGASVWVCMSIGGHAAPTFIVGLLALTCALATGLAREAPAPAPAPAPVPAATASSSSGRMQQRWFVRLLPRWKHHAGRLTENVSQRLGAAASLGNLACHIIAVLGDLEEHFLHGCDADAIRFQAKGLWHNERVPVSQLLCVLVW